MGDEELDGSGAFEDKEFEASLRRQLRLMGSAGDLCGKLFDAIDDDSSGYLEEAEGMIYLSCSGCDPTELQYYWKDLLRAADKNGDGRISKDEFLEYTLGDEELDGSGAFEDKEFGGQIAAQLRLFGLGAALDGSSWPEPPMPTARLLELALQLTTLQRHLPAANALCLWAAQLYAETSGRLEQDEWLSMEVPAAQLRKKAVGAGAPAQLVDLVTEPSALVAIARGCLGAELGLANELTFSHREKAGLERELAELRSRHEQLQRSVSAGSPQSFGGSAHPAVEPAVPAAHHGSRTTHPHPLPKPRRSPHDRSLGRPAAAASLLTPMETAKKLTWPEKGSQPATADASQVVVEPAVSAAVEPVAPEPEPAPAPRAAVPSSSTHSAAAPPGTPQRQKKTRVHTTTKSKKSGGMFACCAARGGDTVALPVPAVDHSPIRAAKGTGSWTIHRSPVGVAPVTPASVDAAEPPAAWKAVSSGRVRSPCSMSCLLQLLPTGW